MAAVEDSESATPEMNMEPKYVTCNFGSDDFPFHVVVGDGFQNLWAKSVSSTF